MDTVLGEVKPFECSNLDSKFGSEKMQIKHLRYVHKKLKESVKKPAEMLQTWKLISNKFTRATWHLVVILALIDILQKKFYLCIKNAARV